MATVKRKNPGAMDDLARKVAGGVKLKVGFLAGATYPDGTSVASVAAFNEFGVASHNQPPRPFFRNMVAKESGKWPKMAASIMQGNGMNVHATLDVLGQEIQGRVKQSITELTEPVLAPSTIARKGQDKPLIDTGTMLNAVSYEIVDA